MTKGRLTAQNADDDRGILYLERELNGRRMVLLFHVRKGKAEFPELEGWKNLISGEEFSGSLDDYEAAVLIREEDVRG